MLWKVLLAAYIIVTLLLAQFNIVGGIVISTVLFAFIGGITWFIMWIKKECDEDDRFNGRNKKRV